MSEQGQEGIKGKLAESEIKGLSFDQRGVTHYHTLSKTGDSTYFLYHAPVNLRIENTVTERGSYVPYIELGENSKPAMLSSFVIEPEDLGFTFTNLTREIDFVEALKEYESGTKIATHVQLTMIRKNTRRKRENVTSTEPEIIEDMVVTLYSALPGFIRQRNHNVWSGLFSEQSITARAKILEYVEHQTNESYLLGYEQIRVKSGTGSSGSSSTNVSSYLNGLEIVRLPVLRTGSGSYNIWVEQVVEVTNYPIHVTGKMELQKYEFAKNIR
jgi:hypothetical protein